MFVDPTIYSSLLHVWEGINLGFHSVALPNLDLGTCTARFTERNLYSLEPSCSLARTTDLGAFWSNEVILCFFPNIGSAPLFSLEWATTLRIFHADWKYYHTKPDYFLPGRSTLPTNRCRETGSQKSPRAQHISKKYLDLSVDILNGVAAARAELLPLASPLTAKSTRMIAPANPKCESRVLPTHKHMRSTRSFGGIYGVELLE
jgi:hypothetical protein